MTDSCGIRRGRRAVWSVHPTALHPHLLNPQMSNQARPSLPLLPTIPPASTLFHRPVVQWENHLEARDMRKRICSHCPHLRFHYEYFPLPHAALALRFLASTGRHSFLLSFGRVSHVSQASRGNLWPPTQPDLVEYWLPEPLLSTIGHVESMAITPSHGSGSSPRPNGI